MNTKVWLHGLAAAFIGGGASGFTSGLASMGVDPEHFNIQTGLSHVAKLVAATFLLSGTLMAFAYLKQSPLPDWDGVTERREKVKRASN